MQVRFGGRRKIQFSDKTHPPGGILSAAIGVVALVVLVVLCLFSSSEKGASGMVVGVLGLLVLIMSVVGFVLAAKCYKKEDIYMVTPAVGTVLNVVLILLCLLLYILGAV